MPRDDYLLSEETHTARKDYWCVHCGETISEGQRYVYTTASISGEIQADHWHRDCRAAAKELPETSSWEAGTYKRGTLKDKWPGE